MYRAGVAHKVRASPRVSCKELKRIEIALESIAGPTRDHEVTGVVCATARERKDMIERGRALVEMRRAVYTPLPAVAECGPSHCAFERGMDDAASAQLDEVSGPRAFGAPTDIPRANRAAFGRAGSASTASGELEVGRSGHRHVSHKDDAPTEAKDLTSGRVATAHSKTGRGG